MKWERGEYRGKEWGRERGRYGSAGNGNARKNSPKTQQIWHLRTPLGGYNRPPRVIHFLRTLFRDLSIADSTCIPLF